MAAIWGSTVAALVEAAGRLPDHASPPAGRRGWGRRRFLLPPLLSASLLSASELVEGSSARAAALE
jgi:hypothetical protein